MWQENYILSFYNAREREGENMRYLSVILVLIFTLIIPTSVMAFNETGMSISAGKQGSSSIGHYDYDHNFNWNSIGVFGRNYLKNPKYIDYIDSELDIGHLKWIPKGKCTDDSVETFSLEGRLMLMKGITSHVYAGVGGGFAFLSDKSDTYQLTKDGFYGLITGRIRLVFFSKPFNREWGLDFETDHISSTFGQDPGQNLWKARAYIMF